VSNQRTKADRDVLRREIDRHPPGHSASASLALVTEILGTPDLKAERRKIDQANWENGLRAEALAKALLKILDDEEIAQ
jgi:hypothetical protein